MFAALRRDGDLGACPYGSQLLPPIDDRERRITALVVHRESSGGDRRPENAPNLADFRARPAAQAFSAHAYRCMRAPDPAVPINSKAIQTPMNARSCLSIVLAAGDGKRMRSLRPKVLHAIGNRTLIAHVLVAVREIGGSVAVVLAPGQDAVASVVTSVVPQAQIFTQSERRGTAHAVLAAKAAIARGPDDVLIVFADTPLIRPYTLARMRACLAEGTDVVVLGFRARDPTGYGRLVTDNGRLLAIREDRDASDEERAISLCNGGLMALRGETALEVLKRIDDRNAKREFYLTDAVATACAIGLRAAALEIEEDEVLGINTQSQLAEAEAVLQSRLRSGAMDAGVTMVAPETVYLSADTQLGRDVVIEPYVVFGPGVVVENGARICSFSYLDGVRVGKGTAVGPFSRLREASSATATLASEISSK
jgi:bifunctional UDP-N-acetylglucosamine pyrophosphorylase / glucosamine-1-phosphate N-acetyltransferase